MPNTSHLSLVHDRNYNVSVVGLPRSGKSCICSRFVFRHPDLYNKVHQSTTNNPDFQSVNVNKDCWLYWGCVCRQVNEDIVKFRIIEQTSFLDGVAYSPFTYSRCDDGHNQLLEYIHRSTEIRLLPKNGLSYICNEKNGEKGSLVDGLCSSDEVIVDGFILVCDVSGETRNSECIDASCFCNNVAIQEFLACFLKVRKPVVMVLSKLDNCDISKLGGLEFFRKSSEFRKIPVIETSAHENINIEEAFLTLFKLMESKVRISKFKHTPYLDAVNKRTEEIQSAMHAFIRLLLLSLPEFLTDWDSFMARYSHHTDVVNYINLVSSSNARRKFETVVQERLRTAKLHSLDRVPGLLMHLLPNLDAVHGFSFEQIVSHVRHHEDFSLYFQDDAYNDCENRVNASCCCPLRNDTRVPFHLAIQPTAESENSPLKEHVDLLTNMRRHHTEKAFLETALHHGFLTLPASCQSGEFSKDITIILPGQPLSDVKANISSLNLPTLTKGEISMVYKQFQLGLHTRVREDFLDLLVEKTGLFIKAVVGYLIYSENSPYFSLPPIISNEHSNELFPEVTSDLLPSMTTQLPMLQNISDDQNKHYVAPPKGVKETQITWLGEQLSVDTRYQAMTYLPSERQTLITSYFDMLFPTIDSHWLISKSINNDVFTTDSGGVQNPRNSTMSNDMDSPVADNLASIDPKMECSSESSNQQYFQPELPSLYSLCPSISWGGCMDFFFKRFVYEYLSTNCNCFKYQFGSCCDSSGICICMNKRVSFKSNLPHNYSISYLPSLTTDQPPLILSIAVACICTDTLAARAIINLLSCAGFCTLPLNSKACKYSSTHCLNHKYHQCDHVKSLITSTAKMINSPDPLVLGATWPLPTTRLFLSNSSSCTNTPVVELCKDICYGEVRVDFMSHHSLSSKLLSHREEFVSKCEQLDDVLKESKKQFTINNSNLPYSGVILITGIPSSDEEEQHDLALNTSESLENVDENVKNETSLINLSENNVDECNSIPHFTLNDQLSDTVEGHLMANREYGPPSKFSCTEDHLSCVCCKLFYNNKAINNSGCACGKCCNCVYSQKSSNHNSLPYTEVDHQRDKRFRSSLICPHRRRSWKARVAAINAIVDLVPRSIPHLVLLTESSDCDSKPNSKANSDSSPPVYLAPESLGFSTLSKHLSANTPCDQDLKSSVPLGSESHPPDWMPAGTNILDHVINFLSDCWNKMSQNASSKHFEKQKVCSYYTPKQNSFISNRSSSPNLMVTANSAPQSSPEALSDKSFSGGLLNTLSIASATGRKAIHSANQALKKLSSGAKRHHNCKLSPVSSTSKGFLPAIFDIHGKANTSEQISSIASIQTNTLESTLLQNTNILTPSVPPPIVLNLSSQSNNTSSEYNRIFSETLSNDQHSVHWETGTSPVHAYRDESPVRKEKVKSHHKNSHLKKFHSKSMHNKIIPLNNSSACLIDASNPSLCRSTVQDFRRLTTMDSSNKMNVQISLDISPSSTSSSLSSTKVTFLRSPDKSSYHENYTDNILHNAKNPHTGLHDDCHCLNHPQEALKFSKQGVQHVHEMPSSNFNATVMADDVNTPSSVSLNGDMPKDCCQLHNEVENSIPLSDHQGYTTSSGFNDHYYSIGSLSQNDSGTYFTMQNNDDDDDDVESIYDEIIPIESLSIENEHCSLTNDQKMINNSSLPQSSMDSNYTEEHIYAEPVDCLGFGCLEKYIIPQNFSHFYTNVNNPLVTDSISNKALSTSTTYSTSTVSLTSTSNTWFGNTIGSRRERYRSFSTPEGCSTASDDVRGSSTSFLSSINFSKSMVHPLSAKQIHSRSVRSSHADELCNGLHLDFSTNSTSFSTTTSPLKSRMHSTDAVFEKLTHYSTPVSSPASITLSDDLSENEFSNFSTIRPLSLPNPLSRSHHHHFWHHPKCPHYQIHRDSQDSGLGTVSPSSSKFQLQCTSDGCNFNHYKNNPNSTDIYSSERLSTTNLPYRIGQQYPCKSYSSILSPPSSVMPSCCCRCTTLNNTPSKPIFIDPSDFQTHHPTQSPLSFPTCGVLSMASSNTNHYYRNPCDQSYSLSSSSSSHSQQSILNSVIPKEFKWFRRNKPLKLFGHNRFSTETQTHSSSPPSMVSSAPPPMPPPPPPHLPPPPPFYFSVNNSCNSTPHTLSIPPSSNNNNLLTSSSSLHLESQQLSFPRCQSSSKSLSAYSSVVSTTSKSKLISFNNTNTTTTTTTISSSPHR